MRVLVLLFFFIATFGAQAQFNPNKPKAAASPVPAKPAPVHTPVVRPKSLPTPKPEPVANNNKSEMELRSVYALRYSKEPPDRKDSLLLNEYVVFFHPEAKEDVSRRALLPLCRFELSQELEQFNMNRTYSVFRVLTTEDFDQETGTIPIHFFPVLENIAPNLNCSFSLKPENLRDFTPALTVSKTAGTQFNTTNSNRIIHAEIFYQIKNEGRVKLILKSIAVYNQPERVDLLGILYPAEKEQSPVFDSTAIWQAKRFADSIEALRIAEIKKRQAEDSARGLFLNRSLVADARAANQVNYNLGVYLLEHVNDEDLGATKSYHLRCKMIVDSGSRAREFLFEDTATILKRRWNNLTATHLAQTKTPAAKDSLNGKSYSFRTIYPEVEANIRFVTASEKWKVLSRRKVINVNTGKAVDEEMKNAFFESFKKRPWNGRYTVYFDKKIVNDEHHIQIRETNLRRAFCLQIAFNFGMIPISFNQSAATFNQLQFFCPSVALLYRWLGVYYTAGIYGGKLDHTLLYGIQPTLLPGSEQLLQKLTYHEGGALLNIGACFYLKGGITYSQQQLIRHVVETDYYYNKVTRTAYGFTAAVCLYPRYFNLEAGYNYTFNSFYAAAGFNIPIKM
ncbi:MAG: hypothetical protein U0T73_05060 [Chitinophagales bacterium]